MSAVLRPGVRIIDRAPATASLREIVHAGLSAHPKRLPAFLFYDDEGSRLFERICELPEYYPTRTELSILRDRGPEIAALLGRGCRIVELGSGSERKARTLLRVLDDPSGYVGIDVSAEQLERSVAALARDFPRLSMTGIVADFADDALPLEGGPLVGFFPGSTIGNMHPHEAEAFLAPWAQRLRGGGMLVGVDLLKDTRVLHAAYNDAAGVTAAFNRNLLAHLNHALGADFDPEAFAHRAFYDEARQRIEMHLVSERAQGVHVAGRRFAFRAGESIHTENSYKYSIPQFQALARRAGFTPVRAWTDERPWFSVHFLAAPGWHAAGMH